MSRTKNKIVRADCSCKGVVKGARPKVCIHYNHLTCVSDSAKEWDYLKNTYSPEQIAPSTNKKAWWICSRCSASYEQLISIRTLNNARCPYCAGKIASLNDNLKINHPELMCQWDYNKNKDLPESYRPGSNKKVWWVCTADKHKNDPNGVFNWEARIADRTKKSSTTGCPSCNMSGYDQTVGGTQEYIKQCSIVHNNKYIYDKVIYTTSENKIIIICPVIGFNGIPHGEFIKPAASHKAGSGCPLCADRSYAQRMGGQDYFILEAKQIHGENRYDYSLVNYKDAHTPLQIICHVIAKDGIVHGMFMQNANNHKNGRGCPKCSEERKISLKAQEIYDCLITFGYSNDGVSMKMEWTDPENLRDILPLRVDYYLFDCSLIIEVDGAQHFKETESGTFTSMIKEVVI